LANLSTLAIQEPYRAY